MAGWSDIENGVASTNPPPKTSNKLPHLTSLLSANDPDLGLIKLKQCFDQCDEDKDGYINQDELKKLCHLLNMKQLESSKGVNSLFHALDDTSRGKIAFVDFLRYKYIYTKSPLSLSSDTETKMISDQTNSSILPNSSDKYQFVVKKELGNPTNLSSEYAASNQADPKTTDTTSAHHTTDESSSLQTCLLLHTSDDNDQSSQAETACHPPIQEKSNAPTSASLLLSKIRVRRKLNTSTLESFTNPNRHSYSSIPLESLPPAPVSVIQQICSDSSDYIPFSDLLTLLQFLGFDPVDIAEDLEKVLQEVPRDGQDRLSVIGISIAMERILLDQEEVPDEFLLRKIALKLYQQEIIMSRRSHQNTLTDRNQLYDTLELNRDENRQLLTVSEEQICLETVHWSNKLNEEKEKHKQKLVALEESKSKELEVIVDNTSKMLEEKDKYLASLEEEGERLKESLRDLKYDKESLSEMLKESRNETLVLEHVTESLKQQLQEHQLSHGYPEQQIDVDNGVGSKLLEEKTRLSESLKSLQDKYDELTAEKEQLIQQMKLMQNKMKKSDMSVLTRPVSICSSKVRELPFRKSKRIRLQSLLDPLSAYSESPEMKRRVDPNLMGEIMEHDLQEVERKRLDTLEHQLLELEKSKRHLESTLTNNDMETQRQRQTHKKEKLVFQNKVSELTAECSHLNELKSKSEDKQMETQTLISKKTQELSELQKQLVGINQQVVHLEMMNQTLTSQMENLEQSKKEEEARGSELLNELTKFMIEKENLEKQNELDKTLLEEQLSNLREEAREKMEQAYTSHDSMLQEVRSEYENQILTQHSQIQTLEQEKKSTKIDTSAKIATLESNIYRHKNEIERLENLRKDERKVEKAIKEELNSAKNELTVSSEAYLEQIQQLNVKISSAEFLF